MNATPAPAAILTPADIKRIRAENARLRAALAAELERSEQERQARQQHIARPTGQGGRVA